MGIFIHLSITKTVTKKEWESVYEESVKMMKAFPFCEMRNKKFFGQDLICIVPTEERMYCGKFGWRTTGDYITLKGAEDYFLPKELTNNEIDSDIEDALMGMAPSCTCIEWGDDRTENCINLWRDKTQKLRVNHIICIYLQLHV